MRDNPETNDYLDLQTQSIKNSILSVYKSFKTEGDETLSYEASVLKKYSLKNKPNSNLKTSNSRDYFTASVHHASSPPKKNSFKLHPLKIQK